MVHSSAPIFIDKSEKTDLSMESAQASQHWEVWMWVYLESLAP